MGSTPTARDVARLAGISQATVSYVLSGRRTGASRISEATRQRILEAQAAIGYVPNHTARSLRRGKTERVCVLIEATGVPYLDALSRDVQRVAAAHGYMVILVVCATVEEKRHALEQLGRRLADGAIITSGFLGMTAEFINSAALAPLVKAGIAITVLSDQVAPDGFDVVRTLERESGYQAVLYLLDRGHRRIAFLGHFTSTPIDLAPERYHSYGRFAGYLTALRARGITIDPCLIIGNTTSRQAGYRATEALLRHGNRPTAIFAASDVAAVGALWAARDAGLRVPDDVAVIGAGNLPEGEITRPPLTTVGPAALDFSDVADLLFSRLRGDAPIEGQERVHPWQLIHRGSA